MLFRAGSRAIGGKGSGGRRANQTGRPPISTTGMRYGETEAQRAVSEAIAARGEGDPIVAECLGRLLAIARGERRGRYVGDEYRAIVQLLDRTEGKPTEKHQISGEMVHRIVIEEPGDGAC